MFRETQFKRWLVAQSLLDEGYSPMKITFGYYYIRDQFCTRDDSDYPAYRVDGVTAPSMPLYVSPDRDKIVGYDYQAEKKIPIWTRLGKADNGEDIYLHHPTQLVVSEIQSRLMTFTEALQWAENYSLSFTTTQGQRVTLDPGTAQIPTGNEWSMWARDGLTQLKDPKVWDRQSAWTSDTSGSFLSRRWVNGAGEIVAPDGDIYFSAFASSTRGNASGPYGFVDTLFTMIDSKAKRKLIFAIPASKLWESMKKDDGK